VANGFPEHAYTTVTTVLGRLVHRGLLHCQLDGRSIRFAVVGNRAAPTAVLMHEDLFAGNDPDATLVIFSPTLSPTEATILRRAPDQPSHD
jgi:predicted transcriptional regulator